MYLCLTLNNERSKVDITNREAFLKRLASRERFNHCVLYLADDDCKELANWELNEYVKGTLSHLNTECEVEKKNGRWRLKAATPLLKSHLNGRDVEILTALCATRNCLIYRHWKQVLVSMGLYLMWLCDTYHDTAEAKFN